MIMWKTQFHQEKQLKTMELLLKKYLLKRPTELILVNRDFFKETKIG